MKLQRLALLAALAFIADAARATEPIPPTPRVYPSFEALPGAGEPEIAALWRRALEQEAGKDFGAAAATYAEIAARLPQAASPRWRAAKAYWNVGKHLPATDREGKRHSYRLTRDWAERGLAVDPQCGECCLFAAAGIGGEVRDGNAAAGALSVDDIAALLERGIAILSSKPDPERIPELEDLYYAAAQLYLQVPDSSVLRWALGVPGDRKRGVEYMRRATALEGNPPDLQVELGALLVCEGRSEDDTSLMAEGFGLLHTVLARPAGEVEEKLRRRAEEVIGRPERACAE